MSAPLRRTRGDLIATAAITAVSALLVGTAYFTAPIRADHLEPALSRPPSPSPSACRITPRACNRWWPAA